MTRGAEGTSPKARVSRWAAMAAHASVESVAYLWTTKGEAALTMHLQRAPCAGASMNCETSALRHQGPLVIQGSGYFPDRPRPGAVLLPGPLQVSLPGCEVRAGVRRGQVRHHRRHCLLCGRALLLQGNLPQWDGASKAPRIPAQTVESMHCECKRACIPHSLLRVQNADILSMHTSLGHQPPMSAQLS